MSAAISRCDAAPVTGSAALRFDCRHRRTVLAALDQRAPVRVLFPVGGDDGVATAVIATLGGGLVSGDRLRLDVGVGVGARAQITAQAAEKIYRSTGADSRIDVSLRCAADGWLEWLPQETIVFDRARFERTTALFADPKARALAGDLVVFGRRASGETLTRGRVGDGWRVHVGGRLVWTDLFRIDGDLSRPFGRGGCLAGAAALATLVYVGEDASALLAQARALIGDDAAASTTVRAGATVVGGVLVVRWLAWDARRLRAAFALVWTALRRQAGGLEAAMPRIWTM